MIDKDVEIDSILSEKTAQKSASSVKVRCPECYKLYSVNGAEVHEPRPRFSCMSCETHFWVPFPEALEATDVMLGFPTSWDRPEVLVDNVIEAPANRGPVLSPKVFNCPKCDAAYAANDTECSSCGVIFAKFLQKQDSEVTSAYAPKEVKLAWEQLVHDYESYTKHQAFIAIAQSNDCLDYALLQYEKVLSVSPSDVLALKAQKEIASIAVTIAELTEVPHWSAMFKDRIYPHLRLVGLLYFLCAIVICIGVLVPELRNLVGFGSAVLFSLLALRFYFRVL